LLLLAAVWFAWDAHKSSEKAAAAQQRTIKEMIEASWKAGSYLQNVEANVLSDPAAEEKRQEEIYASTGSYIPGTRWLYAHLKTVMDLEKMKSLAGMPIFLPGHPHEHDFDFRSYDFGRYNPKFVRWAVDNLIPPPSGITTSVYQKHLKEIARLYYLAYLHVGAHEPEVSALRAKYLESIQEFSGKPWTSSLGSGVEGPNVLVYDTFARLFAGQYETDEVLHWVLDGPEPKRVSYPWLTVNAGGYAYTASGFWIRRQIDGTAPDFFAGLKKLLETYDADFLKDPSAP
jgi:hypothetical protein